MAHISSSFHSLRRQIAIVSAAVRFTEQSSISRFSVSVAINVVASSTDGAVAAVVAVQGATERCGGGHDCL